MLPRAGLVVGFQSLIELLQVATHSSGCVSVIDCSFSHENRTLLACHCSHEVYLKECLRFASRHHKQWGEVSCLTNIRLKTKQ
uniref:Secreted protein n=1 Tax=Ixodes ricinus TaxID=34613 RepID=A0A6B0TZN3_IXORI